MNRNQILSVLLLGLVLNCEAIELARRVDPSMGRPSLRGDRESQDKIEATELVELGTSTYSLSESETQGAAAVLQFFTYLPLIAFMIGTDHYDRKRFEKKKEELKNMKLKALSYQCGLIKQLRTFVMLQKDVSFSRFDVWEQKQANETVVSAERARDITSIARAVLYKGVSDVNYMLADSQAAACAVDADSDACTTDCYFDDAEVEEASNDLYTCIQRAHRAIAYVKDNEEMMASPVSQAVAQSLSHFSRHAASLTVQECTHTAVTMTVEVSKHVAESAVHKAVDIAIHEGINEGGKEIARAAAEESAKHAILSTGNMGNGVRATAQALVNSPEKVISHPVAQRTVETAGKTGANKAALAMGQFFVIAGNILSFALVSKATLKWGARAVEQWKDEADMIEKVDREIQDIDYNTCFIYATVQGNLDVHDKASRDAAVAWGSMKLSPSDNAKGIDKVCSEIADQDGGWDNLETLSKGIHDGLKPWCDGGDAPAPEKLQEMLDTMKQLVKKNFLKLCQPMYEIKPEVERNYVVDECGVERARRPDEVESDCPTHTEICKEIFGKEFAIYKGMFGGPFANLRTKYEGNENCRRRISFLEDKTCPGYCGARDHMFAHYCFEAAKEADALLAPKATPTPTPTPSPSGSSDSDSSGNSLNLPDREVEPIVDIISVGYDRKLDAVLKKLGYELMDNFYPTYESQFDTKCLRKHKPDWFKPYGKLHCFEKFKSKVEHSIRMNFDLKTWSESCKDSLDDSQPVVYILRDTEGQAITGVEVWGDRNDQRSFVKLTDMAADGYEQAGLWCSMIDQEDSMSAYHGENCVIDGISYPRRGSNDTIIEDYMIVYNMNSVTNLGVPTNLLVQRGRGAPVHNLAAISSNGFDVFSSLKREGFFRASGWVFQKDSMFEGASIEEIRIAYQKAFTIYKQDAFFQLGKTFNMARDVSLTSDASVGEKKKCLDVLKKLSTRRADRYECENALRNDRKFTMPSGDEAAEERHPFKDYHTMSGAYYGRVYVFWNYVAFKGSILGIKDKKIMIKTTDIKSVSKSGINGITITKKDDTTESFNGFWTHHRRNDALTHISAVVAERKREQSQFTVETRTLMGDVDNCDAIPDAATLYNHVMVIGSPMPGASWEEEARKVLSAEC